MYCKLYKCTMSIKDCVASQKTASENIGHNLLEEAINRDLCLICKDKENILLFTNQDIEKIKVAQKKIKQVTKIPIKDGLQKMHRYYENIIMR